MSQGTLQPLSPWGWRGWSGTMGRRFLGCFFWVLSKRSFPHGSDIIQQESL